MRNIKFFLMLILVLLFLTGCNSSDLDKEKKEKIKEELNYLDTQIVTILNDLNNITLKNYTLTSKEVENDQKEQTKSNEEEKNETENTENNIAITKTEPISVMESSNKNIDWDKIKSNIEVLNESWAIVVIDLTSGNVDNKSILEFSHNLNEVILSIKKEDKTETIEKLSNLYSYIPKYEEEIGSINSLQSIKKAKAYLINSYNLVEKNSWEQAKENIVLLDNVFKNITNDLDFVKNKEFKVNKAYVLIKEMQNSLDYKDKQLFLIKYSNLIECLNTL